MNKNVTDILARITQLEEDLEAELKRRRCAMQADFESRRVQFEEAVLANTNAGGENCHRGAALGALMGAAHGRAGIPDRFVQELHASKDISTEIDSYIHALYPEEAAQEERAKLAELRKLLTPDAVTRDGTAFLAFLDAQKVTNTKKKAGVQGYCMGGPFTVRSAHAAPDRVRAAASFHGGGLVTDKPDSPHQLLKATKAGYLFAIARNDDARAPGDKDALRAAAAAAGRPAEVEVYPADHGWCTIDAPVFDKVQADRAWARMLALFRTL